MKLNKINIIFISCLLIYGCSCISQNKIQSQIFNIRALGMEIGEIKVRQEEKEGKLFIEAISEFEVRIIFKIKGKYIQTSIYKEGVLLESTLKTYKKNQVKSNTRIIKNGKGYKLDKKDKVLFINDVIKFSGSLLFFNEPKNIKDMYFEISGQKTTVKSMGNHKYLVINPQNGKKNEYFYENKVLKKAIIKHAIANVFLERK